LKQATNHTNFADWESAQGGTAATANRPVMFIFIFNIACIHCSTYLLTPISSIFSARVFPSESEAYNSSPLLMSASNAMQSFLRIALRKSAVAFGKSFFSFYNFINLRLIHLVRFRWRSGKTCRKHNQMSVKIPVNHL
jgi:hypothetical protein